MKATLYRGTNKVLYANGEALTPSPCPKCGKRPNPRVHYVENGYPFHAITCCRRATSSNYLASLSDEADLINEWNDMLEAS